MKTGNIPAADEQLAITVAKVCGRNSAAAQALRDLRKRRAAGLDAAIWRDGKDWKVGTRKGPEDQEASE
jgi:hypothetical protein